MTSFRNAIRCVGANAAITTMSGLERGEIGPPVEYGGRPDTLNPEELFVASINSCLMLVFYHFAEKSAVEVQSYEADAQGTVEKTRNGLRFTNVKVQARIKASGKDITSKVRDLAELAEKYCLVSNSVSCPVSYSVSLAAEGV
jgi:organic hydroperoxide reductase OsmC/OhrA